VKVTPARLENPPSRNTVESGHSPALYPPPNSPFLVFPDIFLYPNHASLEPWAFQRISHFMLGPNYP
jgi:hypothetical protein